MSHFNEFLLCLAKDRNYSERALGITPNAPSAYLPGVKARRDIGRPR